MCRRRSKSNAADKPRIVFGARLFRIPLDRAFYIGRAYEPARDLKDLLAPECKIELVLFSGTSVLPILVRDHLGR